MSDVVLVYMAKNKEIDFICYYPGGYTNPKNKRELNKIWDEINYKGDRKLSGALIIAFRKDYDEKYMTDQDFYIRINPEQEIVIDTLNYNSENFSKDNNTIQLISNKGIPYKDVLLIKDNIYINYSRPKVNVDSFKFY